MSDKGSVAPAAGSPSFSPGPWLIVHASVAAAPKSRVFIISAPTRGPNFAVASIHYVPGEDDVGAVRADANLIATAPDLHEIARKLVLFFGDVPPDEIPVMVMEDPSTVTQFVTWARAALRKVDGAP